MIELLSEIGNQWQALPLDTQKALVLGAMGVVSSALVMVFFAMVLNTVKR